MKSPRLTISTQAKQIWQDSYAVAYTMNQAAAGHGKGPKSTPIYSSGKLYSWHHRRSVLL
jgi:hypothetical protein